MQCRVWITLLILGTAITVAIKVTARDLQNIKFVYICKVNVTWVNLNVLCVYKTLHLRYIEYQK